MQTDDLLDEIYHGAVGLPREERLVAALRVLHGAALERPYPSSGAWTSLLAELFDVALEGDQALQEQVPSAGHGALEAEDVLDCTVRDIASDFGSLSHVRDEEDIAFIVAMDEDADRLARYIKRYWRRT